MDLLISADNLIRLLNDLDETTGLFEAFDGHHLKIRYLRVNEDGDHWFRVWIDKRQKKGLEKVLPSLEIKDRYKAR